MIHSKSDLRKHYRALRNDIPAARARVWSSEITEHLKQRLRGSGFEGTLFLYAPVSGEPDLLTDMLMERYHIALPVIRDRSNMEFFLWNPSDGLAEGAMGIREPVAGSQLILPAKGDVVIVPALAVDAEGTRLGFGGGFYDRWLLQHKSRMLFTAAAVFSPCFSVEPLPREIHDVPVDFCLRNRGTV